MAQVIVNGLAMGAIYALVALGLLFIFNAARIVNFAQGQLLMIGAFLAVTTVVDAELSPPLAYGATLAAMAIIGLVFMVITYAPLRGLPAPLVILTTSAMGLVIENLALIIDRATGTYACRRSGRPSRRDASGRSGVDGAVVASARSSGRISAPSAAPFPRTHRGRAQPRDPLCRGAPKARRWPSRTREARECRLRQTLAAAGL